MSAAIKFATVASGFAMFGASALYTTRNSQRDFSRDALALEHSGEPISRAALPKPKVPSNFLAVTIGGYEIKTAL